MARSKYLNMIKTFLLDHDAIYKTHSGLGQKTVYYFVNGGCHSVSGANFCSCFERLSDRWNKWQDLRGN